MYDTYQLQEHICAELEKKTKNGIKSTTDLDTIWKLIDAYKNLLKIDMLNEADGYSQDGGTTHHRDNYRDDGYSRDGHQGGYSERRKRDSMGRYSREDGNSYRGGYSRAGEDIDRFMDAKQSYRSGKSPDKKQHMMDTLDECMDSITKQVEEMRRDADTSEEREMIDKYLRKLRNI